MELHQQIELIDRLLGEATQHREGLEHTMHAQQRTGTEGASNAPGTFVHPEPYTLQEEYAWWQQAQEGLLMVRHVLEQMHNHAQYLSARAKPYSNGPVLSRAQTSRFCISAWSGKGAATGRASENRLYVTNGLPIRLTVLGPECSQPSR